MQFNNRSFIISRHSFYRVCLGITVGIVSSMHGQAINRKATEQLKQCFQTYGVIDSRPMCR